MAKHALLSPSGAARWAVCLGSTAMCAGLPDSTSSYADEGTAAHFLGATLLEHKLQAQAFFGCDVLVHKDGSCSLMIGDKPSETFGDPLPAAGQLSNTFNVDADMVRHIQTYIDLVRQYALGGKLYVERSLDISHITGEDDAEGTSDVVIVQSKELVVADLKFGMGEEVSAIENPQLFMYGDAALEEFDLTGDIETVRMVIIQPRITSLPSEYVLTVAELKERVETLRSAAGVATSLIEEAAVNGEDVLLDSLTPGEKQCRWCKRSGDCKAQDSAVSALVNAEFDDLTLIPADAVEETAKKQAYTPDLEALSTKMKAAGFVEHWVNSVRGLVETELLKGIAVPDFKLVQGRKSPRAWADSMVAEQEMKRMRLKLGEMYVSKLASPTQIEVLLKDAHPTKWKQLVEHIVQHDGKPSVAPMSDKRIALVVRPPTDDFVDETGSDLV